MSISAPLLLLDDNGTLFDLPALKRGSAGPADIQYRLNTEVAALLLHRDVKEGVTQLRQAGFRVRCSL